MIYPMIDEEGTEWRFVGSRPVSQIADWAADFTPTETFNIERVRELLDSGLFPDLKLKPELEQNPPVKLTIVS
ncbi:MAG: hypothetical protein GY804_00120 [Alphaproteobacteria bacterium]|nr:hypothetical protein [Alphaproteobacteria bacterium]